MKKCNKCHKLKPLDDFSPDKRVKTGTYGMCKQCRNIDHKKYYAKNREKYNERSRKWQANNPEKVKQNDKKRKAANPEKRKEVLRKWQSKNREKTREYSRKWRMENLEKAKIKGRKANKKWAMNHPEEIREKGRRDAKRRRNNPKWKLSTNISTEIRASLKKYSKANRHWEALVDFTVDQLKAHLEKLFKPGMTWENYGTVWHIDHKVPIAVFNFDRPEHIDFRLCWSLKNLQPLEARKNLSKGAKLEKPFQPSLAIGLK